MITADPSKIPYELRPDYERDLVRLLARSREAWERIGQYVDPDLLRFEPSRLLVRAVAELYKEGAHPDRSDGVRFAVQRVQRWSTEQGRILRADVDRCYEDYYLASGQQPLDLDAAASEMAPVLRRQLGQKLQLQAQRILTAHDPNAALDQVKRTVAAMESAGKTVAGRRLFAGLTAADLNAAVTLARMPRIPFGIPELDGLMGGGPQVGRLGFAMGHSGHGKSMFLNHHACAAARNKLLAVYFTGEVLRGDQVLRTMSNLTGVPSKAMAADDRFVEEATIRYQWLIDNRQIVPPIIHPFARSTTKPQHLVEVLHEYEREVGRKADLVVFDADEHLDYVGIDFPGFEALTKKDPGTYQGFGQLYAYFSWLAQGGQAEPSDDPSKCYLVETVSQVKGEPNHHKFRVLSGEEAADSVRKIRICDWCVTINYKRVDNGTVFYVAKGRQGDGAWSATPAIPRAWECARMVPVTDPYPWVLYPKDWRRRQQEFWR